jgi:hypothetical protein
MMNDWWYQKKYESYVYFQKRRSNRGEVGRDSERKKTYRSEWRFQSLCRESIKSFSSLEEAQAYANRVCASSTWKKVCSNSYISTPKIGVVAKERSTGRGHAGSAIGNRVTLDRRSGFDTYTLLHEMAHCAGNMHHGRSFRNAVLKLVSRFIGSKEARILKKCFKENKLAVGEARKPMSFEKWKKMYERMDRMRNFRKEIV